VLSSLKISSGETKFEIFREQVVLLRGARIFDLPLQVTPQVTQTLFVIYIRDSIALRFEPFKRMYENGSKIALNSTCSKGFK